MISLVLVVLLPVALAASIDQRIVNGASVDIANYPWQVSVSYAMLQFARISTLTLF
jgi:secreted trypsin-like serine protease